MKIQLILSALVASILITVALAYNSPQYSYAQTESPVETPAPQPPAPPDEPTPIPPTLLELILEVIKELGGWLTGILLGVIGIAQKEAVSWVRRRFPNDKKTATTINGGVAQVFAGLTAVVLALIAWGVTFATGYVSSFDLGGLVVLAGTLFGAGYTVHKTDKLGKLTRFVKLLGEMSK